MIDPSLAVRIEADEDGSGTLVARSPLVGEWSGPPRAGAILVPGDRVGVIRQLHRRFRLVIPGGVSGRVAEGIPDRLSIRVEYGQQLFRLLPWSAAAAGEAGEARVESGGGNRQGVPEGCRAIVSPTDGVFYRRPSPTDPCFVEVGERIARGRTVAMVEVMKTFNRIVYDGPGVPEEAELVEIRCEDAEAVRAGQVLVVVR